MSERTEYAIRWAEPAPGLLDISTPHGSLPMVEMALEGSAFDGSIVQRTVTESDWQPITPTDASEPPQADTSESEAVR